MIWELATWAIAFLGIVAAVYMLSIASQRGPGRTIDDVVDFLRAVDLEQAEVLLNAAEDHELRGKLDRDLFREIQRKRMQLFLELVRRMAHNARVLVEFGNREAARQFHVAESIGELQREAVRVRLFCLLTILKLQFLLAIRPIQSPSLAKFRSIGEVDGISTYKALRQSAVAVFEDFQRPTDKLILSF